MPSGKHELPRNVPGLTHISGFVSCWINCLVGVIGALIFVGYGLTYFYGLVA